MLLTTGRAGLLLALALCAYGFVVSVWGGRTGRRALVTSGRRAVYAVAAALLVSFAILEVAFARSDFRFELVVGHSSTTTPLFYRLTAIWASQEGSLLLWSLLLACWSSLILFLGRRRMREVAPWATAVLLGFGAFFISIMVFADANPFDRTIGTLPAEGVGLNPLLRHPSMMIHPPMLYSGYTLFTIPFAFAVGALISGRVDAEWIRATRPYTLAAWLTLGVGIVLGARWSYTELGWGGYWAWDPVENASLMPWLTGTAFLHSVMIQERRGMLKVWNASLVLATGTLAILGTFLVRSGILDSIHAFGASTLGVPFLMLISVMIIGSVGLVLWRSSQLRSEHHLDSLLSREAIFLLNNLVLVGLCFVVFWGTFFPLISEAVTGTKASVGPPWFNRYITPLALVLVLLTGLGPVIAWRRATWGSLRRTLQLPAAVGVLVGVAVLTLAGTDHPLSVLMFALASFAATVSVQDLVRGVRARRTMAGESVPVALVSTVTRNRRRYGGYLVHFGVALLFVGIAASYAFGTSRDVRLTPGQSATVGGYTVTYTKPTGKVSVTRAGELESIDIGADLRIVRDGRIVADTAVQRRFFPSVAPMLGPVSRFFEGEASSEIALRAGLLQDVWVAPIGLDTAQLDAGVAEGDAVFRKAGDIDPATRASLLGDALTGLAGTYARADPPVTFRVLVSPMVTWIWLGALVVFLGGLLALIPARDGAPSRARAAYAARVARELQHA